MLKGLFKISNFKLKNLYGLPTINGLVLSAFLAAALWYSIFNNSNTERWIFISMLMMFVINLLETSYPFRMIEINAPAIDPPFNGELTTLNLEIKNPTNAWSGPLWIRLNGMKQWTEVGPVGPNTFQIVPLKVIFQNPGPQTLPRIRFKTYADSGLYRYWRVIDSKKDVIVLPKPVDHKVMASFEQSMTEDNDLSGFVEILDPTRFQFTDPKLYRKTNRRYQRIFQSRRVSTQMTFRWSELEKLSRQHQGEQFSFWLKHIAAQSKHGVEVKLEAPFIQLQRQADCLDLTSVKSSFAKWFYA